MAKKIIGLEKFTSKKGTACGVIHCIEDFADDALKAGAVGTKSVAVMCYGADTQAITKDWVGKELLGFFGYSNGTVVVQSPSVK